ARPAADRRDAQGPAPVRHGWAGGAGLQPSAGRGRADLYPRRGAAQGVGGRLRSGRRCRRGLPVRAVRRLRPGCRHRCAAPRRGTQCHRGEQRHADRRPGRHAPRRSGGRVGTCGDRRRPGGTPAAAGGRVPGSGGRGHQGERRPMMTTVDGSATGYRPTRTLSVRTELRRQASRRRTQLTLGFMVVLPLIILLAFEFGSDSGDRRGRSQFAALADIATAGGLNFALFTLLVSSSFLLIVVVALFHGDTVASEASWGSLRYLLAVPVPRARLLGSKLVVALACSAIALILLTGTALVAGTLRYGWPPLRTTVAGDVPAGTALVRLLAILGYLAISLLVVASLAFLLSVSTD